MRADLPAGTVTFLFTDVEGSTRLLGELGAERYAAALQEHRRVLREAFAAHDGVEVDTQGDAFFVAFPTAPGALAAAAEFTTALEQGPIRVRVGLHTGTPLLTEEGYVGEDVHRAARIAASGHGGQVLVSRETRDVAGVEVTDLGEHRLKDIAGPEWIFQLGDGRFPPLKTISNTNVPRPTSTFVGRETEVAQLAALVLDGARLVTLTGPGGTGKTRLAIEAAAELVPEFRNGVFWVGLAALRDPALVTETIAQTLGAHDGLADHIQDRQLLLLLDNLEQAVDSAPELATLVETCPNLALLVTSRELLRVRGEVEYPVATLADPDATRLFCDRSRLEPDETIGELCRRLDNLPLAVELAAARTTSLSPAQILERLAQRLDLLRGGRDADPRQHTLRATIEWSHDLLTQDEQVLYARLSVFSGGCTLDAVEEVCDADLDAIQALVSKSLLRHTADRYWMLETIREHAAERLGASGDADWLLRRHAGHYLALAEEAEPQAEGNAIVLARLETELDNFRAALDHLESSGETQPALALAGALRELWETGHVNEGRQRLERLLARDELPTSARAKALDAAGLMARHSGDVVATRRRAEEALALYRSLGDPPGIAASTMLVGLALADDGDYAEAARICESCVGLFEELGDDKRALFATRILGWMYEELGEYERARALHEANLRRARDLGDAQMEGQTLTALAFLAGLEGRFADAISMLEAALRIDRDQGALLQTSFDLCRFARTLAEIGDAERAAALLGAAEAIRVAIGAAWAPWLATTVEETRARAVAQVGEAAFAEAWEQGRTLTADDAIAFALGESDPGA